MRKNKWFKMGAGLTAALMLCGSVSVVAFADEADAAAPAAEETVAEEVVTEEVAEEEVADIGDIVIEGVGDAADSDVAPEQEIRRTPSEDEEEVSLSAVETSPGSAIKIEAVRITHSSTDPTVDPYYTVSVDYRYTGADASGLDVTIFAYDVTSVVEADVNTEYDSENPTTTTPVGWVNQDDMAAEGTMTFKVAKANSTAAVDNDNIAAFDADSTILIKMGGTDIATPAAALCDFSDAQVVEGFQGTYGDVDGDDAATNRDAIVVMQSFLHLLDEPLTDDQRVAADVDGDGNVTNRDAIYIMQKFLHILEGDLFPIEREQ